MSTRVQPCLPGDRGFSLLEIMIAMAILTTGLLSLAQLFSMATMSNRASREATLTTMIAAQKLEELRALAWGFDADGAPVGDTATDTSVPSGPPSGGTGLGVSPPVALSENTAGYVDFVDEMGASLGGGVSVPPGAVYARRWSVEPIPSAPVHSLAIQVVVVRISNGGAGEVGATRLATVKTRKAQ